ncbi:MAG: DUF2846 domain-containing protein [Deltaproteobacteria bacterium]|nr:DUF2846 domain-containing protein [Deltaproteobacteria bacterium]
MTYKKYFFLLVLAVLLMPQASHAKVEKKRFQHVPPKPGYATVYLYRTRGQPDLRKPKITVDGDPVIHLPNKSWTYFYLGTGSHVVKSKWGFMAAMPEMEAVVEIQPDRQYFLRFSSSQFSWGFGADTMHTKSSSALREVTEDEAMKDMKKIKKYAPAEMEVVE